uniref:Biotin carboxyl carrier protein of acetyl-CoA carboxylase n=1 Tax=Polysiphonia scopulorum TaxID=257860 RepID=A0A1Z1MIP3_9FLOR|nr:acetyl-CoA carboxylase biotin carboxyl carrier protein [Polysiphonia scopulorum]ARW65621.1 acetyl-CoA carboxylase biotin carboxyl carrier protein [Polysiphonia scopulorum]
MLKVKNLTRFINLVAKSDTDKLKVNKKNTQILINRIKFQKNSYINEYSLKKKNDQQVETNKISSILRKQEIKKENEEENKIKCSGIYSTIVSPMVGTFYQSPAPNEPPFIRIGDNVNTKQPVCIIEAMKLMNEIESEIQGEVVEILVKDGDIVDCGQSLVKIKIK